MNLFAPNGPGQLAQTMAGMEMLKPAEPSLQSLSFSKLISETQSQKQPSETDITAVPAAKPSTGNILPPDIAAPDQSGKELPLTEGTPFLQISALPPQSSSLAIPAEGGGELPALPLDSQEIPALPLNPLYLAQFSGKQVADEPTTATAPTVTERPEPKPNPLTTTPVPKALKPQHVTTMPEPQGAEIRPDPAAQAKQNDLSPRQSGIAPQVLQDVHKALVPTSTELPAKPEQSRPETLLQAQVAEPVTQPAPPSSQRADSFQHALPQPATSPSPISPSNTEQAPATRQLETLIDSLVQARESGRAARGEMVLRHGEFGAISVQIERGEGDIRALVSSRDPGFAPAAQAAFSERNNGAALDSNLSQTRHQDQSQQAGQPRDQGSAFQGDRQSDAQGQRPTQLREKNSGHASANQNEQPATDQHQRGLFA